MTSAYWQTMVGGTFDRSRQHAPSDRPTLRAAALELKRQGLLPADIASALRLSEAAVRDLLEGAA